MVSGSIEVEVNGKGQTVLSRLYSSYPLRFMQTSRGLSKHVAVSVLGYGGGIKDGDVIDFNVDLFPDATLSMFTQGSTKIFKCADGHSSKQNISFTIGRNASLYNFPDPVSMFRSSYFEQEQNYYITPSGSCVSVDWFISGREALGEFWSMQRLRSRNLIYIGDNDKLGYLDDLDLFDSPFATVGEKVGSYAVFGTVLLLGPQLQVVRDHLKCLRQRRSFRDVSTQSKNDPTAIGGVMVSVSDMCPEIDLTIMRFAADTIQDGYELLEATFRPLEKILGYVPYGDRVHARVSTASEINLLRESSEMNQISP